MIEYARLITKSSEGPPTIPPSASHDNGDWSSNDIYEHELYMDSLTGYTYTRQGDTIVLLSDGTGGGKNYLEIEVLNGGADPLPKMAVCYFKTSSSSANTPEVLLADNATEATSSKTMGLLKDTIAPGATGKLILVGEYDLFDTSAYNVGDRLWLGNLGGIVTSPPAAPRHSVFLGIVSRSQSVNGRICIAIQNGYELEELHNVTDTDYTTPQDEDSALVFDSTQLLWKRLTLWNLYSYLKVYFDAVYQAVLVSGTNIKTIEGQSILGAGNIDLTKADVGLSNVDNTSDLNKPISTATQTALNAKQNTLVSGSNIKTINFNSILGSGDIPVVSTLNGTSPINASVGAGGSGNISINQATTSTNGYLSSTDWNTFNNKQAALISGTNIKTINGNSVLGSGNLTISGGPRKYVNTTLQTAIDIFSETIIGSYLIPANTFSPNGSFEFLIKQGASVSSGASVQSKIYINSSNTLTGATLIATSTNNSGSAYYNFVRNAFISSSSIYILGSSLGSNTDFLANSFSQSVVPFDVTAARYFIVTMSCSLPTSVEIRGVKFLQNDI